MNYGFISRKNTQTIKKHIEALKPYDLAEIIIDDFESEVDSLLEKLGAGDSLYIEEPPRDTIKFARIHSYTRKNGIKLYVEGEPMADMPIIELFELYVKRELAKRRGYTK
jgi:hypothetical protein